MKTIDWKITTRCQSNCLFCYASMQIAEIYDRNKVDYILNSLKTLNPDSICLTGGEPLLHNHFKYIVESLSHSNIKIFLSTNGILFWTYRELIEQHLSKLSLPLDGFNNEIHCLNGRSIESFDKVIGILDFYTKNPHNFAIKISTVMTKKNYRPDFIRKMFSLLSKYDVKQWKIYELIPEGRGAENKRELSLSLQETEFIEREIKKINSKKMDIVFVQRDLRDSAYLMIQPNGDMVIPTKEQNENFYDKYLGNIFVDDMDLILQNWNSNIDKNRYLKNCSLRCCHVTSF